MKQAPISAFEKTKGMAYFARMIDKICKYDQGELQEDFHGNLGLGLDGWCTDYLRVSYDALKQRALEGGSPEALLEWCFEQGRELNEGDILIWNHFATKLGWKDQASELLETRKKEIGLADRDDIVTMLEFFEYDEGRK